MHCLECTHDMVCPNGRPLVRVFEIATGEYAEAATARDLLAESEASASEMREANEEVRRLAFAQTAASMNIDAHKKTGWMPPENT